MSRGISLRLLGIAAMLMGSIAFSGGMAVAQGTTESDANASHLAHIHKGTCDNLDPTPQENLNNVEPRKNDDDEVESNPEGVLNSPRVLFSKTDVDMSLDDMLAESHAINVHKSAEEPMVYIACGDIGGTVIDDELDIGLAPLNNSGFYGVAVLKKDGDKTTVEIYLVEPTAGSEETTPNATPVS